MTRALLTKEDIRAFIFEALYKQARFKIISSKEFMSYFNLTEQELREMRKAGMPYSGRTWFKYDLSSCKEWMMKNGYEYLCI